MKIEPSSDEKSVSLVKAGRIRAGCLLFSESYLMIRNDPQTILFAFISFCVRISLALFYLLVVLSVLHANGLTPRSMSEFQAMHDPLSFPVRFVFAFVFLFFTLFYQTAIISTVMSRISRTAIDFKKAMNTVIKNLDRIFAWTFISTSAMFGYMFVIDTSCFISTTLSVLLIFLWISVTFFIVPSIVSEKSSLTDLFERSSSAFGKVWREAIVAYALLGVLSVSAYVIAMSVLVFPGYVIEPRAYLNFLFDSPLTNAILLFIVLVLACAHSFFIAINSSLRAVLFKYSQSGKSIMVPACGCEKHTVKRIRKRK